MSYSIRPMESEWRWRYMTYNIIRHPRGHWVISKDGRFAGTAVNEREAKLVIDEIRSGKVNNES